MTTITAAMGVILNLLINTPAYMDPDAIFRQAAISCKGDNCLSTIVIPNPKELNGRGPVTGFWECDVDYCHINSHTLFSQTAPVQYSDVYIITNRTSDNRVVCQYPAWTDPSTIDITIRYRVADTWGGGKNLPHENCISDPVMTGETVLIQLWRTDGEKLTPRIEVHR